jgi:uncharacterized membrane protein
LSSYQSHPDGSPARTVGRRHGKGDPDSPFVALEMAEIKQMIEFERQNADVSVKELFKPNMLNRLHIGIFTQIWSQLTGMNVMMYYVSFSPSCPISNQLKISRSPTSLAWLASVVMPT